MGSMPLQRVLHENAGGFELWTIYRHPKDYPGHWVLRAHELLASGETHPHAVCFVASTLGEIRAKVPPGTWCMGREPDDDPAIYECWIVEASARRCH